MSNAPPKNPLEERSGNYAASAVIRQGDINAAVSITQETPLSCTVTFDAPQPVAGMRYVFTEDGVSVTYKDMRFDYTRDSIPHGAVANLMVTAINMAMKSDEIMVEADGRITAISGITPNGGFILTADRDTGELIKLSVPAQELEIEFDNFHFLD